MRPLKCDKHILLGGDKDFIHFSHYLLSKILAIYVKAGKTALRVHFLKETRLDA